LLNACDTGSPTAGIDRGGVRTPVTAQGPITGFGSIIVNGVHYDIARADIRVDGAPGTDADLGLGQLVTVSGERDADGATGVAATVRFETNVRGTVAAVEVATDSLVVLGQAVVVDPATVFTLGTDPAVLATLRVGDFVEVSGFVGANGAINATRVARAAESRGLRVRGLVESLDPVAASFNINGLVVDYHTTLSIEGFRSGQPANGDAVVVDGVALGAAGELIARRLALFDSDVGRVEGRETEVEGLITRFVSATDFDVAGVPATTTANTRYEGGSAVDLTLNVKVQIEGRQDAGGVVVATKVEVKDGGQIFGHDD
jgi:hypothetical protein